jgi:hypothetical protein
LEKVKV